jgi:hypothetical protein
VGDFEGLQQLALVVEDRTLRAGPELVRIVLAKRIVDRSPVG